MARVKVVYYQDLDGKVPVLDWLGAVPEVARLRCIARIEQLGTFGHELRRPIADYLGGELYELRVKVGRMNFRIVYFFHGQLAVVLTHGLVKESAIPRAALVRAKLRKERFIKNPAGHTYEEKK